MSEEQVLGEEQTLTEEQASAAEHALTEERALTEEQAFFVYLLECYAGEKGRPTGEVLREWDERGITQYVLDNYLQYHSEAIENAYADIDSMLETGKPAW